MKKIFSLVAVVTLALVLAVPVFAAQKPIDVYINGSKVSFNAGAPYLQNGSVLVPFRAVFEKLGLNVLWDAKTGTVTGTGPDLKIQLKIGSNRAMINGLTKKLAAAPLSSGGTTYVPLRFVGEATGGTVLWEPTAKSVRITSSPSKSQDEVEITRVIHSMNTYFNEENVKGLDSVVASDTYLSEYVNSLETNFKIYNIKSTVNNLTILKVKADEAIVSTTETSLRISGPYTPDQEDHYVYTLVRINGEWKISDIQLQESVIKLSSNQALKAADAPQNDITAINTTLSNYYKALNEESVQGILNTFSSTGEETDAQTTSDFQQYFSNNNVIYTPGVSNVFYYSENEAALYSEHKFKETGAADTYEQGIIFVFSKSSDGTWKISQSYTVFEGLSHS